MIRNRYNSAAAGGFAILMGASVLTAPLGTLATPQPSYRVLSAGTVIPVRLNDTISSNNSGQGDRFTAAIDGNADGLPAGTTVDGTVRQARAMSGKNPGMIDLSFNRITLPNGRSYSINGSPINLDSKSVTNKNGRMIAKKSGGMNRLTYVGIGAGAGLLVNVLAHRKGTLLDTLIGAGAGYGIGSLIKGGGSVRDVELKSGTRLGVRLDRRLALNQ